MKKKGHPAYQNVLFIDSASGHRFVCGSTLNPQGKEVFEGVEYPVSYLAISSTSHPFFTGSKQLVDSEGRVDKFNKRYEKKKELPTAPGTAELEGAVIAESKKAPAKTAKPSKK